MPRTKTVPARDRRDQGKGDRRQSVQFSPAEIEAIDKLCDRLAGRFLSRPARADALIFLVRAENESPQHTNEQ